MVGCLALVGVEGDRAALIAVMWALLWVVVAQLGHSSNALSPRGRSRARGRAPSNGRNLWSAAVLASLLLPVPLYFATLTVQQLQLAPSNAMLPMFAILSLPAPGTLWWMALRAAFKRDQALRPLGWQRLQARPAVGAVPTQPPMKLL